MIGPWPGSSSHYFETTSEPNLKTGGIAIGASRTSQLLKRPIAVGGNISETDTLCSKQETKTQMGRHGIWRSHIISMTAKGISLEIYLIEISSTALGKGDRPQADDEIRQQETEMYMGKCHQA
jgi:hypothetical protein